ncbi:hypothetical protein GHI93_07175 [Lactococcus hircilactis]|uniref:HTH domain-containing protein n=1 Tax=Lactococcus hircilactis TaxID=1494462 RepID=A0A7X1ZAW5_9LACT|nr:hypothetical protein [Lactococcus hircilactis]MQW39705.1 hypothetical protein [Lactococcus hircilactis]
MKMNELQPIDQAIIKALVAHKGVDRAIKGKDLSRSLGIDLRTLQARIEILQGKECAICSIDNIGYFAPLTEEERTRGITKKESMAYSTLKAVMGVRTASLNWLEKMMD